MKNLEESRVKKFIEEMADVSCEYRNKHRKHTMLEYRFKVIKEILNLPSVSAIDKILTVLPSRITNKFLNEKKRNAKVRRLKKAYSSYFEKIISIEELENIKNILKEYKFKLPSYSPADILTTLSLTEQILVSDQYNAKEFIRSKDVVIDAGANVGIFSILASLLTRNKIYAFEPDPKIFKCLEHNISALGIRNVICINKGLGEQIKNKKINRAILNYAISAVEDSDMSVGSVAGFANIEIIPLDKFVKDEKIHKVNFIKIDVEGYELKVIDGAKQTIRKFKPVISVSAYHQKDHVRLIPKQILKIREDYKYVLEKRDEPDYIFY
ncbi:MAG: FkbM family methyltransferase [Candidatus Woesearchaeota archaeon]